MELRKKRHVALELQPGMCAGETQRVSVSGEGTVREGQQDDHEALNYQLGIL